jgi:hypothetical protein
VYFHVIFESRPVRCYWGVRDQAGKLRAVEIAPAVLKSYLAAR